MRPSRTGSVNSWSSVAADRRGVRGGQAEHALRPLHQPAVVQDGIYAALRRFGFTGDRVLEPGAGWATSSG